MKKTDITTKTAAAINNVAEIWASVRAAGGPVLPVRPEGGWMTTEEYAATFNIPVSTARGQIKKALDRGDLKRVKVALVTPNGAIAPHWCYLPVRNK